MPPRGTAPLLVPPPPNRSRLKLSMGTSSSRWDCTRLAGGRASSTAGLTFLLRRLDIRITSNTLERGHRSRQVQVRKHPSPINTCRPCGAGGEDCIPNRGLTAPAGVVSALRACRARHEVPARSEWNRCRACRARGTTCRHSPCRGRQARVDFVSAREARSAGIALAGAVRPRSASNESQSPEGATHATTASGGQSNTYLSSYSTSCFFSS